MPQLFVRIKQIGKRSPVIENKPLEVPDTVRSLRSLLEWLVRQQIVAFNEKTEEGNWAKYLTGFDLEKTAEIGKVDFDAKYDDRIQDADKAVETVLLAFQDGLFRVFLDEEEIESLDTPQHFSKGGVLTFIRLTMLSGRSW